MLLEPQFAFCFTSELKCSQHRKGLTGLDIFPTPLCLMVLLVFPFLFWSFSDSPEQPTVYSLGMNALSRNAELVVTPWTTIKYQKMKNHFFPLCLKWKILKHPSTVQRALEMIKSKFLTTMTNKMHLPIGFSSFPCS